MAEAESRDRDGDAARVRIEWAVRGSKARM